MTIGTRARRAARVVLGPPARALRRALDRRHAGGATDLPVVTDAPDASVRFDRPADPEFSVVIVSYGHTEILDDALAHLAAAVASSPTRVEVVLIDQFHEERGHATARRLAATTAGLTMIRASTNLGFAGGNNLGVATSLAPTVCLLNPDVLVEPGQLDRLLDVSRSVGSAIVAPRLVNPDGTTQERGWRVIHDGHTRPILENDTVEPDYASAACWVLPRTLWDEVGGFDTGYHPAYYEDVDFALRAAGMGHPTVVVEDVPVMHEWSVNVRGGPPEVTAQRERFLSKWADLVAERAGE